MTIEVLNQAIMLNQQIHEIDVFLKNYVGKKVLLSTVPISNDCVLLPSLQLSDDLLSSFIEELEIFKIKYEFQLQNL